MNAIPAIAVFDVGKTNKKLLLFDEKYHPVFETGIRIPETSDEEGFPCEDLEALTAWLKESWSLLMANRKYSVRALNFSAYGASLVYLDEKGTAIPPLYNYLKPFTQNLHDKFYREHGPEEKLCLETASPALGSLNSGLQLYRMKYEKPENYARISHALHLPQYLSYLFCGALCSDITSTGCHTQLWDFRTMNYHKWVTGEGLDGKFPALKPSGSVAGHTAEGIPVGVGLHDSSAALIPYLATFRDPFMVLSTGTWCITLNPFSVKPLTELELRQDCLCYLSYEGRPVKASRLFAGHEHEEAVVKLAAHFQKPSDYYQHMVPDPGLMAQMTDRQPSFENYMPGMSRFSTRDPGDFPDYETAYHQLMADIVYMQAGSSRLVREDTGNTIFVDGGFSRSPFFMQMMPTYFRDAEIYAATVAQASAIGAAMVMHAHWNTMPIPSSVVDTKLIPIH